MSKLYSLYLNCNIDNTNNTCAEVVVYDKEITSREGSIIRAGLERVFEHQLDYVPSDSGLNIFAYTLDESNLPAMIERMKKQMVLTIEANEAYFKRCKDKLK